jgi:hypothetical protein
MSDKKKIKKKQQDDVVIQPDKMIIDMSAIFKVKGNK